MFSYFAYKFLHLVGIFLILLSLGGLLAGRAFAQDSSFTWRKLLTALHGIGLVLVFVAGFGLLARLEIEWANQGWVYLKILGWLVIGLVPVLARKAPSRALMLFWVSMVVAIAAAYLANFKPF